MFQYGVQRRQQSSLGAPPGASPVGPNCGSLAVMKQMLADLGLYMGSIDNNYDSQAKDILQHYAASKGLRDDMKSWVVGGGFIWTNRLCAALIADWNSKFSPEAAAEREAAEAAAAAAAAAMRAGLRRQIRRTVVPGAQTPEPDELTIDPASECAAYGGAWDYATNTCLTAPPSVDVGMSTTTKIALIGGAVILVAGAGYGIYRATR